MTADVHPEDLARTCLGLVSARRELDAAGFPAPARQHLRLDDDGEAELLRGSPRPSRVGRETPVRHRDPVLPEELFPLILVEVQSARESTASTSAGRRGGCASIPAA